jgi:hypothetical protein
MYLVWASSSSRLVNYSFTTRSYNDLFDITAVPKLWRPGGKPYNHILQDAKNQQSLATSVSNYCGPDVDIGHALTDHGFLYRFFIDMILISD